MRKQSFTIDNVHCSACEAKVTEVLNALPGMEEISINILRKTLQVSFNEEKLGVASIVSSLQQAGYGTTPIRFSHAYDEPIPAEKPDISDLLSPFPMAPVSTAESKPAPAKEETPQKNLQEQAFMLNKVHCASCQSKIHAAVMEIAGVSKVSVDTLRKSVVVTFDPQVTGIPAIEETFHGTKYAMKAVDKSAFLPLIPHISSVKQRKIPKKKEEPLPLLQESMAQDKAEKEEPAEKKTADSPASATPILDDAPDAGITTDIIEPSVAPLLASFYAPIETNTESEQTPSTESQSAESQNTEPQGLEPKASEPQEDLLKQDFSIGNVHCTSCEAKVLKLLTAIDGITKVSVNVLLKSMRVFYDGEKVQINDIVVAMEKAGYTASPSNKTLSKSTPSPVQASIQTSVQENAEPTPKKLQRHDFTLGNVHCTACEAKVLKLLTALDGIEKVVVNILRKNMLVTFDADKIQVVDIINTMEKGGFKAEPFKGIMEHITGQGISSQTLGSEAHEENPSNENEAQDIEIEENIKSEDSPQEEIFDDASPAANQEASTPSPWKSWPISLILSLFFASLLMYVAMAPMLSLPLPEFLQLTANPLQWAGAQALLTLPILLINRRIFISGLQGILQASPNMDSLVGLGSATAALFGFYAFWRMWSAQEMQDLATIEHFAHNLYFDSAGMILALIGLGKYFESKARERTGSAIDALMRLSPPTAIVLKNGEEVTIPSSEVRKGDILVVYAGQSLAADGVITQGTAFIDTSAITGESLPQKKSEGDSVIGATICQSGYFQMQVTSAGDDSMLAQIIELVESATASKAPIARLADQVSAIFVPVIIAIAILSFASWMLLGESLEFALSTAISVLVISCPCALGLATPTAIMVGMGMGAEHGILFKSAAAIERMQNINTVVLDKTGTLTHGKPQVTNIIPASTLFSTSEESEKSEDIQASTPLTDEEKELLLTAASLEKLSEHPLASAIVLKAKESNLALLSADNFSYFIQMPGLGISAQQGSSTLLAGNARLLAKENIINPLHEKEKELARLGKTVIYFAKDKNLLGIIAVADPVKETSRAAVQDLKSLGLNVLMLTGDNALTAKAVQEQVDIENILAEVLPHEKEEKVRELQSAGHKVIMVGDGINDAPALARANVGIAVGQGTDIAMQSSDIVLMQSDVAHVSGALKLSRAVMRTIKQNLFWAFAYNTVLIPVAAGVFYGLFGLTLNPMLAAASMSLSSLTVVGNALRLRMQAKNIF